MYWYFGGGSALDVLLLLQLDDFFLEELDIVLVLHFQVLPVFVLGTRALVRGEHRHRVLLLLVFLLQVCHSNWFD